MIGASFGRNDRVFFSLEKQKPHPTLRVEWGTQKSLVGYFVGLAGAGATPLGVP